MSSPTYSAAGATCTNSGNEQLETFCSKNDLSKQRCVPINRKVIEIFLKAYCVFCKTGSENVVVQRVSSMDDNIKAIAPVRVLQERYKKKWIEREHLLIPGYVFVYVEKELPFDNFIGFTGAYKVLEYQTGKRELIGSDYEYASWVYRHNGRIKPSRALVEGDIIKVIDGPLKDGVGTILKLDRHKRRAWVEFDFYGKKHRVSLSVVDITSCEL